MPFHICRYHVTHRYSQKHFEVQFEWSWEILCSKNILIK